jgi:glycosyltransferase involved in cell wall biosynthesis
MAPNVDIEVSVLIPTYNHADFLAAAIDSALAQQLDRPFEILVGDDCSTDGAHEIALQYAAE